MNNPMYHNDGGLPSSSYAVATAPQLLPSTATHSGNKPHVAAPCHPIGIILPVCHISLESHPIVHSSYNLNQTAPLPNQSFLRICEWIKDDGTICGEHIT